MRLSLLMRPTILIVGLFLLLACSRTTPSVKNGKFVTLNPFEIQNANDTGSDGETVYRLMRGQRLSFSWNETDIVNYLGFMNSHEWQYSAKNRNDPNIYLHSFLLGHQFRFQKGIFYLPVSLGASVNNGMSRGNFLRDTCISCVPPNDGSHSIRYFEDKEFQLKPGLFIETIPSLLFGRFTLGVPVFWNYSPVGNTLGTGISLGWNFYNPKLE
jgi:hypothetical protein